jgi:hypothetical protein
MCVRGTGEERANDGEANDGIHIKKTVRVKKNGLQNEEFRVADGVPEYEDAYKKMGCGWCPNCFIGISDCD